MQLRAIAAMAVGALAVSACEYMPDTVDRTIGYNHAVATSTNDLFLLNVIRSSQHEPSYYTRNQSDTATSSFSPTFGASVPLSGTLARTTAGTVNSNPINASTGFLNSTVVTRALTGAVATLSPSLAASTSNQLTLSNMDDQQSINGLLTPVPLQQIDNYIIERYSAEQMYMLYMDTITIPRTLLRRLPDAVAENCATKKIPNADNSIDKHALGLYCYYLFQHQAVYPWPVGAAAAYIAPPADGVLAKYSSVSNKDYMNPDCFAGGRINFVSPADVIALYEGRLAEEKTQEAEKTALKKIAAGKADALDKALTALGTLEASPVADPDKIAAEEKHVGQLRQDLQGVQAQVASLRSQTPEAVVFWNDPALDAAGPAQLGRIPRAYTCFYQVLTALLSLGLDPSSDSPTALYRVPIEYAKSNPRYFADLTQQNLQVGIVYPKGSTTPIAIGACRKASDLALSLSGDGYVKALFALGEDADAASAQLQTRTGQAMEQRLEEVRYQGAPEASDGLRSFGFEPSSAPLAIMLNEDAGKATGPGDCASAVADWQKDGGGTDNSLTISYTPRSLESIVYYLGEVVRREYGEPGSSYAPVTFLSWSPDDEIYNEELFRVEKGIPPKDALAKTIELGQAYYVPALCASCSWEYPDHSSGMILEMLSQIWGINKQQTNPPVVVPVSVIP
jgi:hypothetical protein